MDSTVTAKLLFFAKAKELANKPEIPVTLPTTIKCSDLCNKIFCEVEPALQTIRHSCIIAVDQRYRTDPDEIIEISEGTEIVVCPPLSGG